VPGLGMVVGESKKSNKPSKPPGMYKNDTKTASFLALFALKITENAVLGMTGKIHWHSLFNSVHPTLCKINKLNRLRRFAIHFTYMSYASYSPVYIKKG
jgi:hypothetical protein